jgi:hypothetical protein
MYRIILGPVYGNEKENWRILTNTGICVIAKKKSLVSSQHRKI